MEIFTEDSPQKAENSQEKKKRDGITSFQALVNLVKGMIGPGCLSLPLAFKQSGLWAGLALMFIFGAITYFSFKKIVICSQHLAKRHGYHSLDYGQMAEAAFKHSFRPLRTFSTVARYFVNFCVILMQLGICAVSFVFIKEHFRETFEHTFPTIALDDWTIYAIIVSAICLLVLIRNLRVITMVSLAGNLFMIVALIIILQELITSEHIISELPAVESSEGIILAAGSVLYAYEGQTLILPLENKMRQPNQMLGPFGVLTLGCTFIAFAYTSCGFFGYITYGKDVHGSIVLNLPDTRIFFWLKLLMAIVVYSSYLIQQFVIVDMAYPRIQKFLEERKLRPFLSIYVGEAVFKMFCVLSAFVIAISLHNLDTVISLVGVTAGMLLALVIPGMVHTATFLPDWIKGKEYSTMAYHMFWNILFAISGIFFLIMGVISNVQNIGTEDTINAVANSTLAS